MKKISYLLKKSFKKSIQFFFKLIYGTINSDQNKITKKNLLIKETFGLRKKDNTSYKVCKIINGRAYTDFVENLAVIENGTALENFSYQTIDGEFKHVSENSCIKKGTPRIKKRVNGSVLCLTQGVSAHSNYFHWLFDILPKIRIFSEAFDISNLDYFYVDDLKPYQKKTLEVLGLGKIKVISSKKYRHIQAKELFATEHPWYFKGTILEQANYFPYWIVDWLYDSFNKHEKKVEVGEKIFIDRSETKSKQCQFLNDEEISEFLKTKGFMKYKIGKFTFQEQIHIFKNAKIIFGAHGAALTNLVFCQKGAKVIEIKPVNHPKSQYRIVSEQKKLDYKLIETDELENKNKGDIYLNIKCLENYL
tara:strand:+ start:6248 stop:7336 length:1089 start_codon:yes stop_codon:yes gene_type:complete